MHMFSTKTQNLVLLTNVTTTAKSISYPLKHQQFSTTWILINGISQTASSRNVPLTLSRVVNADLRTYRVNVSAR